MDLKIIINPKIYYINVYISLLLLLLPYYHYFSLFEVSKVARNRVRSSFSKTRPHTVPCSNDKGGVSILEVENNGVIGKIKNDIKYKIVIDNDLSSWVISKEEEGECPASIY